MLQSPVGGCEFFGLGLLYTACACSCDARDVILLCSWCDLLLIRLWLEQLAMSLFQRTDDGKTIPRGRDVKGPGRGLDGGVGNSVGGFNEGRKQWTVR
jgi:hypothetical protein